MRGACRRHRAAAHASEAGGGEMTRVDLRSSTPKYDGPLLRLDGLCVHFESEHGEVTDAVKHVSLDLHVGERFALVGESGSGKSVTALSIMRLLADAQYSGRILLEGRDLLAASEREMRGLRGADVAMVFQEPMTSLNPVLSIGRQLTETLEQHLNSNKEESQARAIELLGLVGISEPQRRLRQYPHHLSGGMRQRVMIAMSLACNPKLIIADEPTTALDVSIQAQIISLLKRLCHEHGTAVMLITHDMGVIAEAADRVAVMYSGRIAEIGPVQEVVRAAKHPYTHGLMGSIPHICHHVDQLTQIEGSMPRLQEIPPGCPFNPRCEEVTDRCRVERPNLQVAEASEVACHLFDRADA